MHELGRILHIARSGRVIVKTGRATWEKKMNGLPVFDSNGRQIGRIQEIFGPVACPYASVQPAREKLADLVGTQVFIPSDQHQRSKGPRAHSNDNPRRNIARRSFQGKLKS
jgi:rRNA processing protein Gar1